MRGTAVVRPPSQKHSVFLIDEPPPALISSWPTQSNTVGTCSRLFSESPNGYITPHHTGHTSH